MHKAAFPMELMEFIGYMVVVIVLYIANIGGLGGGGVVVPTALLFFKTTVRKSIAISTVSLSAAGLVRFIETKHKRDLNKNWKTLIDYDVVLMIIPALIMGGNIGLLIRYSIPEIVINIIILVLLVLINIFIFK